MADIVKITAKDGSPVEFVREIIGSGAMKDVYMSPDKQYVAAFFRKPLDAAARDRLENIAGLYRETIFAGEGGAYWEKLFCWPQKLVEWEGRAGIVSPAYDPDFFFRADPFKGQEKQGKWFASAKLRNKHLKAEQKGNWLKYLLICLNLARAARRLHAAGLAHSDLSYKNVLVDPDTGRACIIDIDGLVVPGKYPPDVVGTPDFIAPEVMATRSLPMGDPGKKLPCIATDKHALAVLIYMYLLYRHPLRGSKSHDEDPNIDEELAMGANALFIENERDKSNRPRACDMDACELPQSDVDKLPYTLTGPHLARLFERAFIDGLHDPAQRPSAAEWENALLRTIDLLQPCQNPACEAAWFVFDNKLAPRCPFCGTPYTRQLPVLNLYWSPKPGVFRPEGHRLMVYDKQSLYMWHVNRLIAPNEKLAPEDKKPVGDFHFHNGRWILINRRLPAMRDKNNNRLIGRNEAVELKEGARILLSEEPGGRLINVQLVNG